MEIHLPYWLSFLVFLSLSEIISSSTLTSIPYHWKPRLDITILPTEDPGIVPKNKFIVLIKEFSTTVSFIAVLHAYGEGKSRDDTLNPRSGFFYTNAYRWALRYISMLPKLLVDNENVSETTKLWEKRYAYVDYKVPDWIKKVMFFVNDWDKVDTDEEKFKEHSEGAFRKYYRYPSRSFNDFKSQETKESKEPTP